MTGLSVVPRSHRFTSAVSKQACSSILVRPASGFLQVSLSKVLRLELSLALPQPSPKHSRSRLTTRREPFHRDWDSLKRAGETRPRQDASKLDMALRGISLCTRNRSQELASSWIRVLAAVFLCSAAFGQKPEFDFFPEFRNVFTVKVRVDNPSVTDDGILERYASSLKADGVTDSEIARRTKLIRTERRALESDYWNRYYSDPRSSFNGAPNAFLSGNGQRAHSRNRT